VPEAQPVDPPEPPAVGPGPGTPAGDVLPRELRAAAIVVLAQAAGLFIGAVALLVGIVRGSYEDAGRAWSDAAIALLGALIFLFLARGLADLRPAVRTPLIVVELLALPVGYGLGSGSGRWGYAVPILASAVVVLALLMSRPARDVLDRR
jgi:hypothetical protein